MNLNSALSSRTLSALDALVSSEQMRLNTRLKQSVLIAGYRVKSGRELQTVGPATEKAGRP